MANQLKLPLSGCLQNVSNRLFTLAGIWGIDFQAAQYEIQQGIEVLEANIAGQGLNMLEKHFAAWQFGADQTGKVCALLLLWVSVMAV